MFYFDDEFLKNEGAHRNSAPLQDKFEDDLSLVPREKTGRRKQASPVTKQWPYLWFGTLPRLTGREG
jgi:hypothetical protein